MEKISISGIVHVVVLDDEQIEMTDVNGDTTVHDGVIDEITTDKDEPFTVTFDTSK